MKISNTKVEAGLLSKLVSGIGKMFGNAFADTLKELGNVEDVKTNNQGDVVFTKFPEDTSLKPYFVKFSDFEDIGNGMLQGKLSIQDPGGTVYPNVCNVIEKIPGLVDPKDEGTDSENMGQDESEGSEGSENSENSDVSELDKSELKDILKESEAETVNGDEIKEVLSKFENNYLTQFPVNTSVKVTLSKVTGSESTDICLQKICCDTDPVENWNNFNTALNSEEVLNMIPEDGEISLDISNDPYSDTISISEISELPDPDPENTGLKCIISELNNLTSNLLVASSITSDFASGGKYNMLFYDAQSQLQELVNKYYVVFGSIIPLNTLSSTGMPISDYSDVDAVIEDNIKILIDDIQLRYPTFTDITIQDSLTRCLDSWRTNLKLQFDNCIGE